MSKSAKRKQPNLIQTLQELQQRDEARRQTVPGQGLDPALAALRAWQSRRLAQTYADLLADRRFSLACTFFLTDIYAARDFSQRDHDFERLHHLLARFLPAEMLTVLADALALNRMSNALDHQLLEALGEQLPNLEITASEYATAYRRCDNYPERVEQIKALAFVLEQVGEGAHWPLAGVTLRLARLPAERAGWFELYDFLARGFAAFRPMKDYRKFARTIHDRELRILDRIFASDPNPFELDISDFPL